MLMDVKVIFGLVMHRVFLAVQDNTIDDLVTHSETERRHRDRGGGKDRDKQRQRHDVAIIMLKSTPLLIGIHHDLKVCERESGQLV